MSTTQIVLEYLRVLLSAPVMAAAVAIVLLVLFRADLKALLLRIATLKFPGGVEFSTTQSGRIDTDVAASPQQVSVTSIPNVQLPAQLTEPQREQVTSLLSAEQATSRLWEYRYLNYFLVANTQRVLDWLAQFPQQIAYSFYDTQWLPIVPDANERGAIINALQSHHLVQTDAQSISVTPKGHEYIQWRTVPIKTP
jgi:hypothetical protein